MHGGDGVSGAILVLSAVVTSLEVQGTLVMGSALLGCIGPSQASLCGCAVPARRAGGLGSPQHPWLRGATHHQRGNKDAFAGAQAQGAHLASGEVASPPACSAGHLQGGGMASPHQAWPHHTNPGERAWQDTSLALAGQAVCVSRAALWRHHQSRVAACKEETGESHSVCHEDSPSASRANSRCWI